MFIFLQSNKAFKRIDIDKKKEEIDKMKTKYGINSEEKKWNCGDFLWLWWTWCIMNTAIILLVHYFFLATFLSWTVQKKNTVMCNM